MIAQTVESVLTVLIVGDDEDAEVSVVRELLASAGHDVRGPDGPDARPDALVVVAGSGAEAGRRCRALREDRALSDLPLLALTPRGGDAGAVVRAGADDHVRLPADPAELALRLERARLQAGAQAERDLGLALVESLQDGLLVVDADGAVLRVNERLAEITGVPRGELLGCRPPYPFWPPDLAERYASLLRLALRNGEAGEADRVYQSPGGQRRDVIVSLSRLPGFGWGPAFVSTIKDVTARRRVEEDLRHNEEMATRLAREQGALRRVAAAVAAADPPEGVFDLVAREVAGLFGVEAGGVARYTSDDEATLVGSWASRDDMRLPTGSTFATDDDSLSARVRQEGRPAREEVAGEAEAHHGHGHVVRRSAVAAPVAVHGVLWGTVGALSARSDGLPPDAEARIGQFAELVSLAIASAEARAELMTMASTDALTGLPNRRTFESRLEAEVARARRSGLPLSIVVLDLDHFKQVNDRHGHEEGDRTLRALADRMHAAVRATDLIARVGGEEFAWLLPGTPAAGARQVADRLRRLVSSAPFGAAGVRTISAGVAELGEDDDGAALMRRADERLYAAKDAGRDRVMD